MKKVSLVVGLIALAIVGFVVLSPGGSSPSSSGSVQYATVQTEIAEGAVFYDVRTPQEYQAGRFSDAQNLPLQDIQAGALPGVDKSTRVYLHCQSGNRSAQATSLLEDAGFTDVVDLGGLQDVERIGGTLVR